MYARGMLVFAVLPLLAFPCRAVGGESAGADIVTMKNGDIHHGTLAREFFEILTPYGSVSVPYGEMRRLSIGRDGAGADRINTRAFERFSGQLSARSLFMLRVLEAPLELSVSDIADVAFAQRLSRRSPPRLPDALSMVNGDRFCGRVQSREFPLTIRHRKRSLPKSEIHFMDVDPGEEGDGARAQLHMNSPGERLLGMLGMDSIETVNRYDQTLALPPEQVEAITFNVRCASAPMVDQRPHFSFRNRALGASVIRDSLSDGSLGPEMVILRGGRYRRGDLQGDGDLDEKPAREIRLKPFAIGMYEVTFEEYDRFCEVTKRPKADDSEWGRGRRPVVNISWTDARDYVRWLSGQTGERYRLPTDAEWEYAARAGTASRFWWGQQAGQGMANCAGCGSLWDGEKTGPVGRFSPNPFGLHDTAGNAWEWVADCFKDSFADAAPQGEAPDDSDCGKRVIRGGAWSFPSREMRSANRWRDFPARSSDDTGLRLARDLEPYP